MNITLRKYIRLIRQAILQRLALSSAKDMPTFNRLLIIAPHPDDEAFGCWGLLARQIEAGGQANILFLTNGGGAHRSCCNLKEETIGQKRRDLALNAAASLHILHSAIIFLDEKDGSLPFKHTPEFQSLSIRLQAIIEDIGPQAVFCPHLEEGWPDHKAAAELTHVAMAGLSFSPEFYYYCVWLWLNMPLRRAWHLNWRQARILNIAGRMAQKNLAMGIYLEPSAPCGNPWVGKLPAELLRALNWDKELFFEAEY